MKLELHPLNQGFTWQPRSGPFRRLTARQVRQYDQLGFVVIEDAFDPGTVERLIAEVDRFEGQAVEHLRALDRGTAFISRVEDITFTTHLVKRSPMLRELVASRLFQDVVFDLIGPDVRLYWDQSVYKKPNAERPFPWHQDNGYLYVEPQQYLTLWLALTDSHESNGCVWVCPELHRHGTLLHHTNELGHWCFDSTPPQATPVPVRAGSVLAFSAVTPHFTGPNTTGRARKAYIIQYAPDGACGIALDGEGRRVRRMASAPDRQFPILVGGRPPTAPAKGTE